ncbi:flagellar hook-associated protein FlgK [Syntrophomonas wolfei]|uniref:Flagellar hook-associated protein 1 n=1 Tax=Syntrophomonas wolfei subsp. wolfei (strain DSM 2245B / Goettingen) TaxID=335541 RepID=Q0B0G0_SYNWW|nr:flagellar hook-associated protein FlgK [Syntrophomonas wolfei]ABI67544.1 Flagellar hook-associated protein-like protein [Syntrophomonas wolfei subsp. wolfei str. Goettingen G311]
MSNFFGLEIGKRSVLMHQTALNITGHNIANANTPGFARQAPSIVTTSPFHAPMLNNANRVGQLGTGVDIAQVKRIRDEFLDSQIRNETRVSGYWQSMQETLDRVEAILNEPSEDGLRGVMDMFWEAWQDLSLNPESESVRSVVVQRGMALAEAFNHTYSQLQDLRVDVNDQIKIKAHDVNSIAQQIAALNRQIAAVSCAGKQPNDLKDKRDLLVEQLSEIAEVRIYNDKNDMVAVQLADRMLVQGVDYIELAEEKDNQGMYMLVWADSRTKARISGGQLGALLDARGQTNLPEENQPSEYKEIIPNMIEDLNMLAKTIMVNTNELHRGGYSLANKKSQVPDGSNFFKMPEYADTYENWAKFMAVTREIQDDVKKIAAASRRTWDTEGGNKENFGDGGNALKIAQLKHSLNSPQFKVKTEGLNIDFSSHDPLRLLVDGGAGIKEIEIPPPYSYPDMQRLAQALQKELDINDIVANVRCEGGEIVFYSTTNRKLEIIYPGSAISDLKAVDLQNGEYQIKTWVGTGEAQNAKLSLLQSYNQKPASSIFGDGRLQQPSDPNLAINASIEITISSVNNFSGQVNYTYVSHEYDLDGNYNKVTGSFTLNYGGAAEQSITIGSLTTTISGLDGLSSEKSGVAELKVGDKGILALTAAREVAIPYQQVDINFNFNSDRKVLQSNCFVFNNGVLDPQAPDTVKTNELHFFTMNDNRNSNLFGRSYDGYIEITNGILVTAEPAAYLSYYEGDSGNSDMVEDATTDDFWRSITANTGVVSQEAQRMVKNQEILLSELQNKWESISGVSLDEEMTNMIKFQHAFNAASRFITGIDEGLEVIINRMGLVGR